MRSIPRRSWVTAALLVVALRAAPADEEAATQALTWHHEGFAAIAKAANDAKAQGRRLLLGLSGGHT